ncbi:MAG: tandem-95 repeat protein, partial [Chloroflexi bacterium]|nr:tandem-95 repeat protein [Chloroflexota bacterium]
YEQKSQYEVVVNIRDTGGTIPTTVTVNVRNREETGTLTLSSSQPQVNSPLAATLTDPDIVISSDWQWQRSTSRSSGWSDISGATTDSYTPVQADINYYLRATVEYEDGHSSGKRLNVVSSNRVRAEPPVNHAPEFAPGAIEYTVNEDRRSPTTIGQPVTATDQNNDTLTYSLEGADSSFFRIDSRTAQIRIGPGTVFDHEDRDVYSVTVVASDPSNATASKAVAIRIGDVNERPSPRDDTATTDEDTSVTIDVLSNDTDPEEDDLTVRIVQQPANGTAIVNEQQFVIYTPAENYNGNDGFGYEVSDPGNLRAQAQVSLRVSAVNDPPDFASATADRSVFVSASEGDNVGAPIRASDVDLPDDSLSYELTGADAVHFEIDDDGQITVAPAAAFDLDEAPTLSLTVRVTDGEGAEATIDVTVTVTAAPPVFVGGGIALPGGGGPPPGPTPSEADFEWTVEHDIEALDGGHGSPTGLWSDGTSLWLLDNPEGSGDAVYAYDRTTGERAPGREFPLDERNRAPRGAWSDGETIWVSDSGQDRLFAYDLESGERDEERDIELHRRNGDPRGIWSDGGTVWVLDSGRDALFAYDLESGELLAECVLADENGDPRGLWSDGVTLWVSNHDPKRLFAYRLPSREELETATDDGKALERVPDEDFAELSGAGNNSPRGIWSDGSVMYVADENDDRVYTYNMPDAWDARLASLSLEGVDIGEFDPDRTGYEGVPREGAMQTTVAAAAAQDAATVDIAPPDADDDADGHQVDLAADGEITVTVTSPDGSRVRVYTVALAGGAPPASCLSGDVSVGFSLLIYEGGSLEELESCAESRHVNALYALDGGEFVPYVLGAPGIVNSAFSALYADGVPGLTPLTARSEGPASADAGALVVAGPWESCLRGEISRGLSHVLYEGGGVGDLAACAEGLGVTALYALEGGEFVPYILGAPAFVNSAFRELFADGVAAGTPLVARGE